MSKIAPEITTTKRKIVMAILPWAIIALTATAFAGIVTGWTLRSTDQGRIEASAKQLVESMSKTAE